MIRYSAIVLSLAQAGDTEFLGYLAKYGKSYATKSEYEFRSNLFAEKLTVIAAHNSDPT